MAVVNQVQSQIQMGLQDIIKFQILVYCYLKRITTSDLDLDCLTLLAVVGETTITEFCNAAISNEVFGSVQSVRNALTKAEHKDLVIKNGKNRKRISIHPNLKVQTSGNILLQLKVYRREPVESQVSVA